MKKAIAGIVAIIIVCIVGIKFSYSSNLGSMKDNITSKKSSNSQITFNAKKGDKVKVAYNSSVKEGTLKLKLTDSNGKAVENFEPNENSLKQVPLDDEGEYVLSATYTNFIGNYQINCK
ncbi:hypothetical protein [Clostridium estertheticum]|uniref:hypothetical protein n=1 Tax=Clostridium estertheticum TaxID=238834 RepID=UPI001C0D1596|nr:hypothetical protein [Clostridium estertheticum]MBU3171795.1 hypothetical protein [Clostridium estertheticum]